MKKLKPCCWQYFLCYQIQNIWFFSINKYKPSEHWLSQYYFKYWMIIMCMIYVPKILILGESVISTCFARRFSIEGLHTLHSKLQIVGTSFEILSVAWSVWGWVKVYHPECWMIKSSFAHTLHSTLQIVSTYFENLSVAWSVWHWVKVYHPECWMIKSSFVHALHSTLQIVGTSFEILSVAWSVWHWVRVTSLRVLNDQNFVLLAFWSNGKVFNKVFGFDFDLYFIGTYF